MIIAERILNGETAEEIGIKEIQYRSRQETLVRFLDDWDKSGDFETDFTDWLIAEQRRDYRERQEQKTRDLETRRATVDATVDDLDHGDIGPGRAGIPFDEDHPDFPSYGEMFKGLARSAISIAKSGAKVVSNEEHKERFDICSGCYHLIDGRCQVCGCFMKVKTKFKTMSCPLEKW